MSKEHILCLSLFPNQQINMHKVSIIIPIYKTEAYIGACLDSIFEQECDIAEIECLLVNDCTPDKSMEIVEQRIKKYKGNIIFKILNHSENQGLSAARNTGMLASSGDYILHVDSDDMLESHAIRRFLESIGEKKDIDIVMGDKVTTREHKRFAILDGNKPVLLDNSDESVLRKLLRRELYHNSWNKFVNRDFVINNNILFEKGLISEDILWSYLLFRQAKRIIIIPEVTYIYRNDNPQSITNTYYSRIHQIIRSRITTSTIILRHPPRKICPEYFSYIYFFFIHAISLFEENRQDMKDLKTDLYTIRDFFLKKVWQNGYYLGFFIFLTLKMPFYMVFHFRFFRTHIIKMIKLFVEISS